MADENVEMKRRVDSLDQKFDGLVRDLAIIEKYVKAQEVSLKQAILTLVEALTRSVHGATHLSAEEQLKIKKLLGVG